MAVISDAEYKALKEVAEAMEQVETWCKAYPRTVFIEPTKAGWAAAEKALNRSDTPSLTAVSGSNMRHVTEGIQKIISPALAALREIQDE